MVITYHGASYIRVSFGDITLAFNPISKDSKLKSVSFGSDVVLISLPDPDMNGAESASRGEREPFVISGPGEYEIKEVFISGFSSPSQYGKKNRLNTIYLVSLEGMNICHLGALSSIELPHEAKEELDDIDILFLPIGGDGVLDPAEAHKLAVSLEPRLIVPVHFGEIGEKGALQKFLKEEGDEGLKPVEKLTVKKKDLEGKEGEIVVLSS